MTERQKQGETVTAEERQPRLSTADMAAAARRPQMEQPSTTAEIQDDALPVEPQAPVPQMSRASTQTAAEPTSLLATDETHTFRSRWDTIQTSFVDEPRQSVEQADGLVAEVMQRLAEMFAEERDKLESQWNRGDDVSTEDLRLALRRYRSFFDRLLSM
ncbi:MAG TPA: hypothetical protein VFU22_29390 [Roseiflexaceae bacterium]|nr:hypothetical protein [Roseiflexaceae bacterium]